MKANRFAGLFLLLVIATLAEGQPEAELKQAIRNSENGMLGLRCRGSRAACVGPFSYKVCTAEGNADNFVTGDPIPCPPMTRCVNGGIEICVALKTSSPLFKYNLAGPSSLPYVVAASDPAVSVVEPIIGGLTTITSIASNSAFSKVADSTFPPLLPVDLRTLTSSAETTTEAFEQSVVPLNKEATSATLESFNGPTETTPLTPETTVGIVSPTALSGDTPTAERTVRPAGLAVFHIESTEGTVDAADFPSHTTALSVGVTTDSQDTTNSHTESTIPEEADTTTSSGLYVDTTAIPVGTTESEVTNISVEPSSFDETAKITGVATDAETTSVSPNEFTTLGSAPTEGDVTLDESTVATTVSPLAFTANLNAHVNVEVHPNTPPDSDNRNALMPAVTSTVTKSTEGSINPAQAINSTSLSEATPQLVPNNALASETANSSIPSESNVDGISIVTIDPSIASKLNISASATESQPNNESVASNLPEKETPLTSDPTVLVGANTSPVLSSNGSGVPDQVPNLVQNPNIPKASSLPVDYNTTAIPNDGIPTASAQNLSTKEMHKSGLIVPASNNPSLSVNFATPVATVDTAAPNHLEIESNFSNVTPNDVVKALANPQIRNYPSTATVSSEAPTRSVAPVDVVVVGRLGSPLNPGVSVDPIAQVDLAPSSDPAASVHSTAPASHGASVSSASHGASVSSGVPVDSGTSVNSDSPISSVGPSNPEASFIPKVGSTAPVSPINPEAQSINPDAPVNLDAPVNGEASVDSAVGLNSKAPADPFSPDRATAPAEHKTSVPVKHISNNGSTQSSNAIGDPGAPKAMTAVDLSTPEYGTDSVRKDGSNKSVNTHLAISPTVQILAADTVVNKVTTAKGQVSGRPGHQVIHDERTTSENRAVGNDGSGSVDPVEPSWSSSKNFPSQGVSTPVPSGRTKLIRIPPRPLRPSVSKDSGKIKSLEVIKAVSDTELLDSPEDASVEDESSKEEKLSEETRKSAKKSFKSTDSDEDDVERYSSSEEKKLVKKAIKKMKEYDCSEDEVIGDTRDCKKYYRCVQNSGESKFKHMRCSNNQRFDSATKVCVNKKKAKCFSKKDLVELVSKNALGQ